MYIRILWLLIPFLRTGIANEMRCQPLSTNVSGLCAVDNSCLCGRRLNTITKTKLHSGVEMIKDKKRDIETNEEKIANNMEKIIYQTLNVKCTKYIPASCQEVYDTGREDDGIYIIKPKIAPRAFPVICDMSSRGVIAFRRFDGSQDFELGWNHYKKGFGDFRKEFWMGLEHLYEITNDGNYVGEFHINDGNFEYVTYLSHFKIGKESDGYCFIYKNREKKHKAIPNGTLFSTHDRNPNTCRRTGGWWFDCSKRKQNPMGKFVNGISVNNLNQQSTVSFTDNGGAKLTPKQIVLKVIPEFIINAIYAGKAKFEKL